MRDRLKGRSIDGARAVLDNATAGAERRRPTDGHREPRPSSDS